MENGRCRMHGGKAGRPLVTGRYSLAHRQSLAQKQAQFLADPNPADLSSELALMRALLQDYLERYAGQMPAEEITRTFGMIEAISKLVERVSKMVNETALTQAELGILQETFIDVLCQYVPDPTKQLEAVGELESRLAGGSRHQRQANATSLALEGAPAA